MTAQPKHPGQHMAGQGRCAHQLRRAAAEILEDKYSLLQDIVRRVDELIRDGATGEAAWKDKRVKGMLVTIGTIERMYARKIAEAEHYDSLMQDIGA